MLEYIFLYSNKVLSPAQILRSMLFLIVYNMVTSHNRKLHASLSWHSSHGFILRAQTSTPEHREHFSLSLA